MRRRKQPIIRKCTKKTTLNIIFVVFSAVSVHSQRPSAPGRLSSLGKRSTTGGSVGFGRAHLTGKRSFSTIKRAAGGKRSFSGTVRVSGKRSPIGEEEIDAEEED